MANAKSFKGGLKGYWRKRGFTYSRLSHPKPSTVVLGSDTSATASTSRGKRFFRIPRRIRFLKRIGSPKRWLAYLRDAYVRMMLRLASSASLGYGYSGADVAFGPQKWKEYDEKMLVEIYKQVLSQGAIVPAETGVDGRQIVIK